MTEERTNLEVIAPTVEEAIETGLADLNMSIDDVEIETIDEGSKGLFGLGGRQARIKITIKNKSVPTKTRKVEKLESKPIPEATKEKPAPIKTVSANGEDPTLKTARETVSELLEQMHIHAQVTATFMDTPDEKGQIGVLVEVTGEDLSILIGRKTETLNALQYITSLIVGKRLEKWIPLVIDVEGYRGRRERQLIQLALKMAEQAVTTGRRQTLEPMPANERRIVHIALRDHPQVTTESTGEEPFRKLTIIQKK
jgi:spoIIIJ-associated protein